MVSYFTIEEKAKEWDVTIRHVQYMCRKGKIEGAVKRAGVWFIPENVPIPIKNTKKSLSNQKRNFRFVGTKNKIFNSAVELFLEKGFSNVSTKDIANRVGIRQATIYNHFKSKKEILDTIYDFYSFHFLKERVEIPDLEELVLRKNPMEIMNCISYEIEEEHRQRMLDITTLIIQRIGIDDRAKEIAKSLIVDEGINYVENVFDRAVKVGRFAPFDTHLLAVFINAIRIFTLYYWIVDPSSANRSKLLDDERRLYQHAFKLVVDLKQPAF